MRGKGEEQPEHKKLEKWEMRMGKESPETGSQFGRGKLPSPNGVSRAAGAQRY